MPLDTVTSTTAAPNNATAAAIADMCIDAGQAELAVDFILAGLSIDAVRRALADHTPPPPPPPQDPEVVAARAQRLLGFMLELDAYGGPAPEARKLRDPAVIQAWRLYDARRALQAQQTLDRSGSFTIAMPVARCVGNRARQPRRHRRVAQSRRGAKKQSHGDDGPGLPADDLRLRRGAEHLHRLGARAIAAFILEVTTTPRSRRRALDRLDQWRARLTPELLRAVGGDRFPSEIHVVPHDED